MLNGHPYTITEDDPDSRRFKRVSTLSRDYGWAGYKPVRRPLDKRLVWASILLVLLTLAMFFWKH